MEEKEFSFINMIPFIDVMLVLLTIVLTTSTFVISGVIPVELPKTAGKHEKIMKTNIVEIDKRGYIFYQGKPVSLENLRGKIRNLSKETPFLIRADRDIPLQDFVDVLDMIKTGGFKRVSLQTEGQVK